MVSFSIDFFDDFPGKDIVKEIFFFMNVLLYIPSSFEDNIISLGLRIRYPFFIRTFFVKSSTQNIYK